MKRFENLEEPKELLPDAYEDEVHPLKEEDWRGEVETYCMTIKHAVDDLQQEIGYFVQQTPIIRRFRFLRKLLKDYGAHKPECKYFSVETPRIGEEYKLCDCGWYAVKMNLRRRW